MAAKRATAKEEDETKGEERGAETTDERAGKGYAGPIAKPKKTLIKPNINELYPWAVNRAKAERAHTAVYNDMEARAERGVSQEDIEQRVMDHYVSHGGLVRGQEKATVVGRRHPIKEGETTTEAIDESDDEDDD